MKQRVVVVGGGMAAASIAVSLRRYGFDGEIVLVCEEPCVPYERPPLSKAYLRGASSFDKLVGPARILPEHAVECLLGVRAVSVHVSARQVTLSTGQALKYDFLALATGVCNRRLAVPGARLDNIFSLRTVADADRIRAAAVPGRKAVVVGMGFIGCEVAATLRQMGLAVTAVDLLPLPLHQVLGEQLGTVVRDIHAEQGVELLARRRIVRFEGDRRVTSVVTDAGDRLDCDFVVLGVGVEPSIDLLAGSGINTNNGIVVDECCRTSADGVFAAGDVANQLHPVFKRYLRLEHWKNAIGQGQTVARAILGDDRPYGDVPWFWSDQYEHSLQYAGLPVSGEPTAIRGRIESRKFVAFWLEEGRVLAAAALNRPRDLRWATDLIRAGVRVRRQDLEDESVQLRALQPVTGDYPEIPINAGEIQPARADVDDLPEPLVLPDDVETPSAALARLRRDER